MSGLGTVIFLHIGLMTEKVLALLFLLTTFTSLASSSGLGGALEKKTHDSACVELRAIAQQMGLLINEGRVQPGAFCDLPWDPMTVITLKEKSSKKGLDFNSYLDLELTGPGVIGQRLILSREGKNVLSVSAHIGDRRYRLIGGVVQLWNENPRTLITTLYFTANKNGITITLSDTAHSKAYDWGPVACFSSLPIERDEDKLPQDIAIVEDVKVKLEYIWDI